MVQTLAGLFVALCLAGDIGERPPRTMPVEVVGDETDLPAVSESVARQAVIEGVESPKPYFRLASPSEQAASRGGGLPVLRDGNSNQSDGGFDTEPRLRPFSRPWEVVGVVLEPIREANLLLPERLDPFASRSVGSETNREGEPKADEEYLSRLKKQRELLGTSSFFPSDPSKMLDVGWHFQVQAGGSFRAGNNTAANVNTQARAERHSLQSDFLARLQAFYTQVQEGSANRRVFGETNYDRNLRGRWLCYAREELEYDEARLINIRTVTSGGIGFRFIDSVYERLIARTGPTASYVDYASPGQAQSEFRSGWLIEGEYRRVLGQSSRLEMTSTMFPDFDSDQAFRIRTEGAILFPIGRASVWNWKVGVRHEYIMNPVMTTNPNDVEGYFSIVYTK